MPSIFDESIVLTGELGDVSSSFSIALSLISETGINVKVRFEIPTSNTVLASGFAASNSDLVRFRDELRSIQKKGDGIAELLSSSDCAQIIVTISGQNSDYLEISAEVVQDVGEIAREPRIGEYRIGFRGFSISITFLYSLEEFLGSFLRRYGISS